MRLLRPASAGQLDLGLAILRVVAGVIFVAHGGQKLFVMGLDGLIGGFGQMGVPLPALAAPAVAFLELVGGFALIAGFLTRLVAIGLAITMLGAIAFVHLAAGFFLPNGYEFVLALLAIAVTLAVTGAGRHSIDARLAGRTAEPVGSARTSEATRRAA
jgi:putative oxidoreductase